MTAVVRKHPTSYFAIDVRFPAHRFGRREVVAGEHDDAIAVVGWYRPNGSLAMFAATGLDSAEAGQERGPHDAP